jgi:hypothetical protein
MSTLNWRTADVELHDGLVPNPRAEHELLSRLTAVRVAIEGSFLHIDPQNNAPAWGGQTEYSVTIVPASAVKRLTYKAAVPAEPAPVEVQVF